MVVILIICMTLIGVAGYLYYKQEASENKREQTVSNTTTEEKGENPPQSVEKDEETKSTTESGTATEAINQKASTATEEKQNAKLPDNYEWDEKRWGEPPQIIYDFAENQEKFDFIVKEVDSLLSEGEGFSTVRNNDKLYSESKNGEQLKKDIDYLLNNTKFYMFTKKVSGHWDMEYNQDEHRERYTHIMIYDPEMTEEEAWGVGYIKVVGDWYFIAAPLA